MTRKVLLFVLVSGLVISFAGCPKPRPEKVEIPEIPKTTEVPEPVRPGPSEEYRTDPNLNNVFFDYDKFDISQEGRDTLQQNSGYLMENKELEVLVEGNCCECGTNEYNLALGEKRAAAVRDYYIKLGVGAGKVTVISYGEENPINLNAGPPDSHQCRANRRAETKVRTAAPKVQ